MDKLIMRLMYTSSSALIRMGRSRGTGKKFKSHTATVICRFCTTKILAQNYRGHIKTIHPRENYSDS